MWKVHTTLTFDDKSDKITIDDSWGKSGYILLAMAFMQLLFAATRIYRAVYGNGQSLESVDFVTYFIFFASIGVIIYASLFQSLQKTIPVSNIKKLHVTRVFGEPHYSLLLSNGRKRALKLNGRIEENQMLEVL